MISNNISVFFFFFFPCFIYSPLIGSSKQLENTELSNGIVQDDPEIIAQQTDKVDILLQCIKTANEEAAWIYGQVLCQMIRDLVPPKEILTKVIKEFLAINQPHSDVIAMIVFQVSTWTPFSAPQPPHKLYYVPLISGFVRSLACSVVCVIVLVCVCGYFY